MENNNVSWLQEHAIYNCQSEIITEGTEGNAKKKYYLKGEFSKVNEKNKNGRIYPKNIMLEALNQTKQMISDRRMLGEIEHPKSPAINLKEVSHVVTKLELNEDGVLYGEAEVLDTPNGEILKNLIESNIKLGISSRGYGKVIKKGDLLEVAPGYNLVCFDVVADPSSNNAYPSAIHENVEYIEEKVEKVIENGKTPLELLKNIF